jgi:hypothetical protein
LRGRRGKTVNFEEEKEKERAVLSLTFAFHRDAFAHTLSLNRRSRHSATRILRHSANEAMEIDGQRERREREEHKSPTELREREREKREEGRGRERMRVCVCERERWEYRERDRDRDKKKR